MVHIPGPVLEGTSMYAIFQKNSNKMLKDEISENLGKNIQNLKII